MRETHFIDQNKEKWKELEQTLEGKHRNPEKLNELFVQVTDDLSYSRTFYPNRSVRVYLNGLAQRIFMVLYKNRKSSRRRLITFWTAELPQLISESGPAFRLSFFIFLLAMMIGMLSSAMDPEFPQVILGESYIQMTLENIDSGDPMAVYKEKGKFGMFLGITMNNLYVAFLTFVMGAFYMIGSIVILVRNGIMLGTFQYFFIERDLFWESFLTIWIHGTLEISAIIIAGAAGIIMGQGLVFPGTYTRLQSFQKSARKGLKIMIGITPIIILAGLFEGFLTRLTEVPELIRGLFILFCLLFVLLYFVWYPLWRKTRGLNSDEAEFRIPSADYSRVDFSSIKPSTEIFSEIFVLYSKFSSPIFLSAGLASMLFCLLSFLLSPYSPAELFSFHFNGLSSFQVLEQFFSLQKWRLVPIFTIFLLSIMVWRVLTLVAKENQVEFYSDSKFALFNFVKAMLGATSLYCILWINNNMVFLGILFGFPFLIIWTCVMIFESRGPVNSLARTGKLLAKGLGKAFGLFSILLVLGIVFFMITDSAILWFFVSLLEWVIHFEQQVMNQITTVLLTFITLFAMCLIFSLFLLGLALLYYSLTEIVDASSLKADIQNIGARNKIRGLDRE